MKKFLKLASLFACLSGLMISCEPKEETIDQPTDLKVGTVSQTTAELSWTAPEGVTKFNLSLNDKTPIEVTGVSYKVSELAPNTSYTWKVQSVKGILTSGWVNGVGFKTREEEKPEPPTAPTKLTLGTVTDTTAELSWVAADGIEKYNLSINGNDAIEVTGVSYKATGLTPNTSYTWKVQSIRGKLVSDWAQGPNFTTDIIRTQFIYASCTNNYGDWYLLGGHNLQLQFADFDPYGEVYNGICLSIDIITKPMDTNPEKQILDLPAATYPFAIYDERALTTFLYTSEMYVYKNDEKDMFDITGGTIIIEGTNTDYTIKFDITYKNSEDKDAKLSAIYVGPLVVDNPFRRINIGTLTGISQFQYYSDPFKTGTVDAWLIRAYQAPDVYLDESGFLKGTGWCYCAELYTPINSGQPMPDHEYIINSSHEAWSAIAGDSRAGMFAVYLENGKEKGKRVWLNSGTMKSTHTDGSYKIDVETKNIDGGTVTLSIQGTPPTPTSAPLRKQNISMRK